jgi:transposase
MYYRFVRTPAEDEHDELKRMCEQEVGRVAQRAHMVLLSTREFTIPEICTIFDVVDETVYKWFDRFDEEGPSGLFDREREGRPRELDAEDEAEIERVLEGSPTEEGYDFSTWTVPLIQSHLKKSRGTDVSCETVRRAMRRLQFVWKRPCLHIDYTDPHYEERMAEVQAAQEYARAAQQTDQQQVTLLYEDETSLRRLPPLYGMWMRKGQQARVQVPDYNAKKALYGALNPLTGETYIESYPKAKSDYTEPFIEGLLERIEGTVILVWDHASWHTSNQIKALIERYERLRVVLLPKRAPQENPLEDLWRHLKREVAANLQRRLDHLVDLAKQFFERMSNQEKMRKAGLAA